MRCPFLREATVRYCRAAPLKKMIVHRPGQSSLERCSSPDYVRCPVARQQNLQATESHCPFLHECLVQYCAAASVTKYIPYSESALSRCGTDSHRYCELYLAVASGGGSERAADPPSEADHQPSSESAGGVHLPRSLWYSRNHFWLDVSPEGMIHVGIDAFMAALLEGIQKLEFVEARGLCQPAAVVSVRDVELRLVFPNLITMIRPNGYLKTAPAKLTQHPYGSGWLFEGAIQTPHAQERAHPETAGLLTGAGAHEWMKRELQRLTEFLQLRDSGADLQPMLADGGLPWREHLGRLSAPVLLRLFNEFFRHP